MTAKVDEPRTYVTGVIDFGEGIYYRINRSPALVTRHPSGKYTLLVDEKNIYPIGGKK